MYFIKILSAFWIGKYTFMSFALVNMKFVFPVMLMKVIYGVKLYIYSFRGAFMPGCSAKVLTDCTVICYIPVK